MVRGLQGRVPLDGIQADDRLVADDLRRMDGVSRNRETISSLQNHFAALEDHAEAPGQHGIDFIDGM